MFCPKCGRINPDEETICKGCGSNLHEGELAIVKKPKRKGRVIIAAVVAVLVIALACVVAVTLSGCSGSDYDDEQIERMNF